MGPLIDYFGFVVLYGLGVLLTVATLICIWVYIKGQEREQASLQGEMTKEQHDDDKDQEEVLDAQQQPPKIKSDKVDTLGDEEVKQSQQSTIPNNISLWTLFFKVLLGTAFGVAFMLACICVSAGMAVVESLLFLYFEFLSGSNTLCGLTVALTVLFEIPIFHIAPTLLRPYGVGILQ